MDTCKDSHFARDFSHLYSRQTLAREPSPLETTFHLLEDPKVIYLAGGLPLKNYFPWNSLSCNALAPPFKNGINADLNCDQDYFKMEIMKSYSSQRGDIPLSRSLQYGSIKGHSELLEFLKDHTKMVHNIQYSDWNIVTSIGNTYGWDAALRVFCDVGDVVLMEEFTYPSSISCAVAHGVNIFSIPTDENGIVPERLQGILENWSPDLRMPKILYTIPTGQNPTGTTLPFDRRVAIFSLAQKYDIIIVEDEPYYFLQAGATAAAHKANKRGDNCASSLSKRHDEFLNSLVESFLSIDTEGRVLRLDSFSKILAPGARLGWITGSKEILQQFLKLHETSMHFPSGFSQTLISNLLHRWGHEGYLDWLMELKMEYCMKRKVAIECTRNFLCDVPGFNLNIPTAGMFFTINIDASLHPDFATKFGSEPQIVEKMLFKKLIASGVVFAAGSWFKCDNKLKFLSSEISEIKQPLHTKFIFFRGTYASVSQEELIEGIRIFCKLLHDEFKTGVTI
ncbi:hypothetical protein BZL39_K05160 [Zygosaccharomyces parabailii]|nr:hypothetical protein BZL39_K05160 [Zygosaccharomyces parabailii]